MDFRRYNQLRIDGRLLKGAEIVTFCKGQKSANMHTMAAFVEEWLSPIPTIELQTSGSTGKPKKITVLKSQMLASAAMTADYFDFQEGQTALLCLPIQYIAAKMMIVRAFYSVLNLVVLEPSIEPLKDFYYADEIDFVPLIPSQAHHIHPDLHIRQILLGGAPVHEKLQADLQDKPYSVYLSYGMTETLSHIAIRTITGASASPFYRALKDVVLKVDDRSCLYLEVPFLETGIQTNDVVQLIGENTFLWKGRYDNIINSGGLKFFPEELEAKIATFVKYPFFIGSVKDLVLGEKVVLCIESGELPLAQMDELRWHLKKALTRHEMPKEIYCIDDFARTQSGKVRREETLLKCD